MRKKFRAALYLRVSTDQQTVENQRISLEAVAQQRGWEVIGVFDDNGVSGATIGPARPAFGRLLQDASRGKIDIVAVWALDRLGRSLPDLLDTLRTFQAAGVDLFIHQQSIDTSTPAGRMFFGIMGAVAEFERDLIRSRVKAGLERARKRGVKIGRHRISPKIEAAIRERLQTGQGILKTAKELGLGTGTVHRVRREMDGKDCNIR
jgi:DNA invertase Pin-like site-specific DNA recombinase